MLSSDLRCFALSILTNCFSPSAKRINSAFKIITHSHPLWLFLLSFSGVYTLVRSCKLTL